MTIVICASILITIAIAAGALAAAAKRKLARLSEQELAAKIEWDILLGNTVSIYYDERQRRDASHADERAK